MATLYLAEVLGWYLVIISLFVLLRYDQLRALAMDVMTQRGIVFVMAIITVILGLFLVVGHNVWVMGWPVLVTLLCWMILLSGLARLFLMEKMMSWGQSMLNRPSCMRTAGIVYLVVGLFLLFNVYRMYFSL